MKTIIIKGEVISKNNLTTSELRSAQEFINQGKVMSKDDDRYDFAYKKEKYEFALKVFKNDSEILAFDTFKSASDTIAWFLKTNKNDDLLVVDCAEQIVVSLRKFQLDLLEFNPTNPRFALSINLNLIGAIHEDLSLAHTFTLSEIVEDKIVLENKAKEISIVYNLVTKEFEILRNEYFLREIQGVQNNKFRQEFTNEREERVKVKSKPHSTIIIANEQISFYADLKVRFINFETKNKFEISENKKMNFYNLNGKQVTIAYNNDYKKWVVASADNGTIKFKEKLIDWVASNDEFINYIFDHEQPIKDLLAIETN